MSRTRVMMMAAALIFAGGVAQQATAQKLNVSASGNKKVTLSNKVGQNLFNWTSSAPMEKIAGTADGVTGTITLDPKNLATIRGTITVPVASMKTGNTTRDNHLRGADWLDAGKYPTITFTIASVNGLKVAGNSVTGNAVGSFTMHGVSKQLTIPFKLTYVDESEKTRERAPGDLVLVNADFSVALKDFNVAGSRGVVGSKVGESIDVKAQLFGSTGL